MLFFTVFLLYDAILQTTSTQICQNLSPPSTCGLCSSLYYPNLPFSWFPSTFLTSSCLPKDSTTNYNKEVFITSLIASQGCLTCNGSINAPYTDIFTAFSKEMQLSVSFLNVTLSFYLIGQQHYLYNNSINEHPEIYPFFRKQYANISLQPLSCQKYNVNGCFSDPNAKAEIYLKSKNVVFFISKSLLLLNLEFFGFDMNLNWSFLSQNTSTHCQPQDLEILSLKPECFMKNSSISMFTNFEYGFFNMEFLSDCNACNYPRILFKNCGFHYLSQKDNMVLWSFIAIIANSPNSIEFNSVTVDKSYFQMGFVFFPDKTDLYYPYSRSSAIVYYVQSRGAFAEFLVEINGFNVNSYNYFGINPLMTISGTNFFLFSISMDLASEIYDVAPKLYFNARNLTFSNNLCYFSMIYASPALNTNSYIKIDDANFTNNYISYFISLNTSISNFTLSNSFFSNNTGLTFLTEKNVTFFFIGFHLSHHPLPISPIFILNSNIFSFQNSSFIDIFPQTTPTSLFSITQWSTYYSIERYEYGNYTNDNLEFLNVTFAGFANVSMINSILQAITTLTIVNCVFRDLKLDQNSQFVTLLIEFNFMLSHSIFYNIKMHTIFLFPFGRNSTLKDIVYSNSQSNFMKITGVPGVHHRSLYEFSNLLFENITLPYSLNEVFFYLFSIYDNNDFDCLFSDIHFKSISFFVLQTNQLFSAQTCSAFSLSGLIFENNSNANYFSVLQYPYPNEINLVNFSNFKFLNPAYSSDFFIHFQAADYLELSDSYFYSGDSSTTGVVFTSSCVQNCALVFKNVQIVFSKSIIGSAMILSYFQSFQHIAIDNCTFINGGSFLSLQYVNSIFDFASFDTLKFGFFENTLPELIFLNQSLVLLKNSPFFNFPTFRNSLKLPGIRSSNFTQTTPRQSQSFSLKFGDILLISCSFKSIQGGVMNILQDTSLLIYNSSFENCSSKSSGGVLSISVAANILISFSNFAGSLSMEKGGVLYSEKNRIILFWDVFDSSQAEGEGGAIYLLEGIAKFEGCKFINSNSYSKGGDIFATASYFEAIRCNFTKGYANSDGSTIYSLANYLINFSLLSISNSTNLQMGVVCIVGIQNIQSFFRNISFVNNFGVSLAVKEGNISLENSLFSENYGTVLINCFSSFQRVGVVMRNSRFIGNNFTKAVLTGSYADFIINYADFNGNILEKSLFNLQFSNLNLNKSSLSVVVDINFQNFGFLIYLTQCQILISNTSFKGNSFFGGISSETSNFFLKNSVFTNCTGIKGGALRISSAVGVIIENVAFLGNTADFGAAIYSIDSNLTLSATVFLENQVNDQGSCIFSSNPIEGSFTQITINDSIFKSYNQMISIDKSFLFSIENSDLFCLETPSQALYLTNLINTIISQVNISSSSIFPAFSLTNTNEGMKPIILNIINSNFLNNSASANGGAISLTGTIELRLINSHFFNNSAKQNGGAIYFDCSLQICSDNLYITNCFFSNNSAQQYGGAIKAPHTENYDIFALNRFKNNSAASGNDLSSEVFSFLCLDSQNTSIFPSMAIYPGVKFDLKCQIFDAYNQSLIFDQTGTFLISFNESDVKASHQTASLSNGFGVFNELTVISLPGSLHAANLSFSTPFQNINYSIKFRFLPCKRGEVFLNLQCLICDIGYYSFSDSPYLQNKSVCDVCDPNAVCPGGDKLIPKPGYWRIDENSSKIIACTTADQCPDQTVVAVNNSLEFVCGESYYGHICANCQQGFYENGNGLCQKCENLTFYYAIFFSSVIALTLFLVYQAKQALEFHEEESKERSMLKLLINHINYLTLLNSCDLSLSFPDQISFLVQLNHEYLSILSQNLFNIDCFLMELVSKDNIVAGRVIFRAISPVLFFLFSLSIIILIELFDISKPKIPFFSRLSKILPKKKGHKKDLPIIEINAKTKSSGLIYRILNFVGAAFIICTFNFYSQILINTFTMVKCMSLDESQRTFLLDDPDIECWNSPKHNYLINDVFLPNLLIWCLGWPLTLFLMLRLYKRSYMKKMEQRLMLDRKSTINSKILDRENSCMEAKREPENKDEENSNTVTKRNPSSFSSKSHFKVMLNNFTKNKRSMKEDDTRPKAYSVQQNGTLDKIPEDFNKVRSISFKKSLWQKMTSFRKNTNSKACFILSAYQEQILFNNNKVILFLTIDYKYECYYWETFFYLTNLLLSLLFTFSSVVGSNLNLVGAGVILMYFIMLLVTEVKRPFKYEFINNLAAFSYIVSIINVGLSMMSSVKNNSNQQNEMYLSGLIFSNVMFIITWAVYFNIVKMKQFLPQFKNFYYFLRRRLMRYFS